MSSTEQILRDVEARAAKISPINRLWGGTDVWCPDLTGSISKQTWYDFPFELNDSVDTSHSQLAFSFSSRAHLFHPLDLTKVEDALAQYFDRTLRGYLTTTALQTAIHVLTRRLSELDRENELFRVRLSRLEEAVASNASNGTSSLSASERVSSKELSDAFETITRIGEHMGWQVEWRMDPAEQKVEILTKLDDADHVGSSMWQFYEHLARELPAHVFEALSFDLDVIES